MKALTPLRGVAALAVLAQHAGAPIRGYLGVDLFFLLSGFVLMHAYGRMETSGRAYAEFLKARLARIYPVHLVLLIVLLPLFGRLPLFSGWGLAASLLLLQSPWHSLCWNFPSWSISAEWHAYLAFPVLAKVYRAKSARALFVTLLGCAAVVGLNDYFRRTGDITNTPVVFLRCGPEFIAGLILYRLREINGLPAWFASNWAFALAATAICACVALGMTDGLAICLLAVVILSAARDESAFARLLDRQPFRWLGEVSYSIYMVQGVVVVGLSFLPHVGPWAYGLLLIGLSILVAAPLSRFIEYPARRALRALQFPPAIEARPA
jgi:peptidoglycan/LPS O-acetylase OafA/YrhL